MTRKEEKLIAMQNIGVSAVICGILVGCMAANCLTITICCVIAFIGFIDAAICQRLLDKQSQKNKGPQASKHRDLYL